MHIYVYVYCVIKTFPGEMLHTRLLTTNREPTTDQSMETNKVQLGELMNSIGVIFKGSLTGAEMT